jgi:hypothetical protein
MLDFISSLPSNDKIEDYRDEELDLQLLVIDWLWGTSIDVRLARLNESNIITIETTKKANIDGKRVDVPHQEIISALSVSQQWSWFVQSDSTVLARLNKYRFYPYTDQLAEEFSAKLRTRTYGKDKPAKYALVTSQDDLKLFNLWCRLKTMEGQTKHFFGNARGAFLRDTRATFMALRAHWETPREEARVTHRAHNNLGIGAEARSKAMAELEIDTTSLRAQIDQETDPGRKLELMERFLRYQQGKADLTSKYAMIAKENTEIIKELRAPVAEKFGEIMRDGEQFIKEDLLRNVEVQRKLREATNE